MMGTMLGHLRKLEPKDGVVKKKKPPKEESIGQRGKGAEKEVKEVLEGWNNAVATFAYERLPDSRTTGGRVPAQIADFMVWHRPVNNGERLCVPLEVKSTKHPGGYLLAKAKLDQLPRLKKSALAGAFPWVLVHFTAIDKWRIAPIAFFNFGVPSWNLSKLEAFDTPKDALQSTGFFPTHC